MVLHFLDGGVEILVRKCESVLLFFCYVTGGSILREWEVRSGRGGCVFIYRGGETKEREREGVITFLKEV